MHYDSDAPRPQISVPCGLVNGPTQSRGSELHHLSQCRPCGWYWGKNGCKAGADCAFCHMCGIGELKARRQNKTAALREARKEGKRVEAERKWAELQDPDVPKPIGPHYHLRPKNAQVRSSGYTSSSQESLQEAGEMQNRKNVGLQPRKDSTADVCQPGGEGRFQKSYQKVHAENKNAISLELRMPLLGSRT